MNKLSDTWFKKFWPHAKERVWFDAELPIKTSINKLFTPYVLVTYESVFEDGVSVFWSRGRYNFQVGAWFVDCPQQKTRRVMPLKIMIINNPHVVDGYPTE